jgi:DNA-binding NarL/FixJ family response regulator
MDPAPTMDAPIRILVVDDHLLLRQGIASVLEDESDMKIVATADTGNSAVEQFHSHLPDVTLMDVRMPDGNGIEAITCIRRRSPGAKIIVITTFDGDALAVAALKAGASAYLLKKTLRTELIETIRAVNTGKRHVPADLAAQIAERTGDDPLSDREIGVLRLVAEGNSNKLIAAKLSISESTVKAHMKSIMLKLDAQDRAHAVTIALKRGIMFDWS